MEKHMNLTTPSKDTILLFDEQERFLSSLCVQLHDNGFKRVFAISDRDRLDTFMADAPVAVVIFGVYPPVADSLELMRSIRHQHPKIKIIAVSSDSGQETAVASMKLGAVDVVTQPLDISRLTSCIHTCLGTTTAKHAVPAPQSTPFPDTSDAFATIVTRDRKMQTIFRYIEAIAPTSQAVLVTGETGTGKELIARALHSASGRAGDFVSVNVAGLDDIMFSDTLFGHGRGAFTGADRERKGLIEKATGGTLFLDEIGDLSIASQVKLLRLLQEDEYYRLGSDNIYYSTARIIVATNSSIEDKMNSGHFRTDLYYRLCSHHIHLPALRERRNDIPLLVEHFSREAAQELSRPLPLPSADMLYKLVQYKYPGNVRELKGLVHNAVATSIRGELVIAKLAPHITHVPLIQSCTDVAPLQRTSGRLPTLKEAEEYLIKESLRTSGGNQRAAAAMLGISRQALNKRLLRDAHLLEK